MSVFLERQKVRKRKALVKSFRLIERVLLTLTVILGGLAILYGFYLLVFVGPSFAVRDVLVQGELEHVTKEEVENLSQITLGQNLFSIDVSEIYKRLKQNPWINYAAVRRRLPHTVWIFVEEYKPKAVIVIKGKPHFVDRDGVVFKEVGLKDMKAMPVITGMTGDLEVEAVRISESLSVLDVWKESLFGQLWGVSEVHMDELNGFSIITERGPIEVLVGHNVLASRLELLGRWQGIVGRRGGRITYIIANEDKRITVGYKDS